MASLLFIAPPLIASASLRTPPPSAKPKHRRIACKATPDHSDQQQRRANLDRREVLLGLGGLAGLTSAESVTSVGPIQAPDLTKCHTPDDLPAGVKAECCPPMPTRPVKPTPPKLRVRLPAHELNGNDLAKYKLAMELMRALPDDDPRSFKQQADVHCAYCNGAYGQVGFPNLDIQVHDCWLFLPFHRWQLYFYERILGKLIGDPDFALPFWNWDHPDGMRIPPIFTDPGSPLYDVNRNSDHVDPPAVVDLAYDEDKGPPRSDYEQIRDNLSIMQRVMVGPGCPMRFFGKPFGAGDKPSPGRGTLENTHNSIHTWCGNPRNPNGEDLGNFYSSGRDPLFYSLHGNVDRLWSVWKALPDRRKKDFDDEAWLDASFVFYDENAELVRVRVGDALDSTKLGYTYKDVDNLWLRSRPIPFKTNPVIHGGPQIPIAKKTIKKPPPLITELEFPVTLDGPVRAVVPRLSKEWRSKEKEEDKEEVLVIQGIEYDKRFFVSFDVYVNDEDDDLRELIRPSNSEFVGAFRSVRHGGGHASNPMVRTDLMLGLTDVLEDLKAEDDDSVVVTLVPRSGVGKVKIGGIETLFC